MRQSTAAFVGLVVLTLSACQSTGGSRGDWPYPAEPQPASPSATPAPMPMPAPVPAPTNPPPTSPALPIPPVIPTPPPSTGPDISRFPRSIEASGAPAPVVSLVKKSKAARGNRAYDAAEADLERALRIAPRNPWVWQQLGVLHLAMGQGEQAISEARKSNSLAAHNPFIEIDNYRVLQAAYLQAGQQSAANEAQARVDERRRWLTQPPLQPPP